LAFTKKILIIAPFPSHPVNSGRTANLLGFSELLKEMGYTLYYLWIAEFYHYNKTELDLCRNYWKDNFYFHPKNILNCIKDRIYRILFHSKKNGNYQLDAKIPIGIKIFLKKIKKKERFDAIIINYVYLSKLFKFFKKNRRILFTHDVFSNRYEKTGNDWFSLTPFDEAKGLNRAEIILSVQEEETVFFKYLTNKEIYTIYCCLPVHPTPLVDVQNDEFKLLYLSGDNPNNIESIKLFYYEVFLELKKSFSRIKLVVGGTICKELEYLEDSGIELQGDISNLYQFYSQADICINPTFNGTGIKIKTFEALSFGKILVAHPHSIIGVFEKETIPVFLAENKSEYVDRFYYLFNHSSEWNIHKNNSIEYMTRLYNHVKNQFAEMLK
jgi:glycosyltransferase involved in cell wall biosynthesis